MSERITDEQAREAAAALNETIEILNTTRARLRWLLDNQHQASIEEVEQLLDLSEKITQYAYVSRDLRKRAEVAEAERDALKGLVKIAEAESFTEFMLRDEYLDDGERHFNAAAIGYMRNFRINMLSRLHAVKFALAAAKSDAQEAGEKPITLVAPMSGRYMVNGELRELKEGEAVQVTPAPSFPAAAEHEAEHPGCADIPMREPDAVSIADQIEDYARRIDEADEDSLYICAPVIAARLRDTAATIREQNAGTTGKKENAENG